MRPVLLRASPAAANIVFATAPTCSTKHPSPGVGTVADLVKLAKARSGQLNYGSGGNGGASHLAGELFNVLAGVKTIPVPYKGTRSRSTTSSLGSSNSS